MAATRQHVRSAALATACAALLGACGADDPVRDGSGAITTPGEAPLLQLQAGDCIANLRESLDNPDGGRNGVPLVRARSCAEPHDAQILRIAKVGGEEWPGYSVVSGEAARGRPALNEQLLAADVPGGVQLFSFSPSKERWNFEDQHEIVYISLFAEPQRGALESPQPVSGGA